VSGGLQGAPNGSERPGPEAPRPSGTFPIYEPSGVHFVRKRGLGGSLKWQVAVGLAMSILLVTTVLVFALHRTTFRMLREQHQSRAIAVAKSFAAQSLDALGSGDARTCATMAERAVRNVMQEEDVLGAAILKDGRVLGSSDGAETGRRDEAAWRQGSGASKPVVVEGADAGRFQVVAPVYGAGADGADPQLGAVRIAVSTASVEAKLVELRRDGLVFGGIALVVGMVLSYFLAQRKVANVARLARAAERFEGRSWTALDVPSADEIGILFDAFNRMATGIREQLVRSDRQIREITEATMRISAATSEILSISTQQAKGAAQQAMGVEGATDNAERIAVSARRIADHAQSVTETTDRTLGAVQRGTADVDQAIEGIAGVKRHVQSVAEAMLDLGAQSQHIGGIIDIINDISEQTNLLALNAAIEASGAGEAGRRFAVVAKEVRRLAERTVEATQEIAGIIEVMRRATNRTVMLTEEGYKAADAGAGMVDQVGVSLRQLQALVGDAAAATREITASTQRQTQATDEMVRNIAQIRQIAQEVRVGAEETSKSISELNQMAASLSRWAQ